AHTLLIDSVNEGDTVIDATCGNGNDTLFLAKLTGEAGHVYAFDIQQDAITRTKEFTKDYNHVHLIHDSHANLNQYLQESSTLDGAIYNLGYLPISDKTIITIAESTIEAITSMLKILNKNKRIVIGVYHRHECGKVQINAVIELFHSLDQKEFSVLQYRFMNQINKSPFVIGIEKNLSSHYILCRLL